MSVTFPEGFRASGVHCGLKENGKKDFALVVNDGPLYSAGVVTTTNRVYAAPVQWTRNAHADGHFRAVVLNSGGANACTGASGYADAVATAHDVAVGLSCASSDIAVCSTGLIGERLDMRAVRSGVAHALENLSSDGGEDAAQAIMTTDTRYKVSHHSAGSYSIGGMAKGAGMLAPQLATMLVVLTTDAVLDPSQAQKCLEKAMEYSFNVIDSDGCMSTNDTVILLANGASGVTPDLDEFTANLTKVSYDLALQLIGDAEGASHDIFINVHGATSRQAALAVARSVSRSNLFKTAVYGNDPNWGRILSSIGVVPEEVAPFDPAKVDVAINGVKVCVGGGVGEDRNLVDMTPRWCEVDIYLNAGEYEATIVTNDLTHDYVEENSAYSS